MLLLTETNMNYKPDMRCRCDMARNNVQRTPYTGDVNNTNNNCCIDPDCINTFPLVMAYVPMQVFRNLYDPDSALCHGTIFRELDLPFYPASGNSMRRDMR